MRRIILEEAFSPLGLCSNTIAFSEVNEYSPIFAKKDGILIGMIVKQDNGWILHVGGSLGATGWHPTLRKCLESCLKRGYEFYYEENTKSCLPKKESKTIDNDSLKGVKIVVYVKKRVKQFELIPCSIKELEKMEKDLSKGKYGFKWDYKIIEFEHEGSWKKYIKEFGG